MRPARPKKGGPAVNLGPAEFQSCSPGWSSAFYEADCFGADIHSYVRELGVRKAGGAPDTSSPVSAGPLPTAGGGRPVSKQGSSLTGDSGPSLCPSLLVPTRPSDSHASQGTLPVLIGMWPPHSGGDIGFSVLVSGACGCQVTAGRKPPDPGELGHIWLWLWQVQLPRPDRPSRLQPLGSVPLKSTCCGGQLSLGPSPPGRAPVVSGWQTGGDLSTVWPPSHKPHKHVSRPSAPSECPRCFPCPPPATVWASLYHSVPARQPPHPLPLSGPGTRSPGVRAPGCILGHPDHWAQHCAPGRARTSHGPWRGRQPGLCARSPGRGAQCS